MVNLQPSIIKKNNLERNQVHPFLHALKVAH